MKSSLTKILKTTNNVFTFSGSYTDLEGNTHNYTLFSNDTFRQLVKQLFGMRIYNYWDDESKKDAFTDAEQELLKNYLPDNMIGHTILVMLATGVRSQEILALLPEDIADDGSSITINKAIKMVDHYKEAGFSTVFTSDHISRRIFDNYGDVSWKDKVTMFMAGYYRARHRGLTIGVNVLFSVAV